MKLLKRIFKVFLWIFGLVTGILVVASGVIILIFYNKGLFAEPDFSRINDRRETSIFYEEGGKITREYCTYCREIVSLDDTGLFKELAVAVEDKHFWTRPTAFDGLGILRAAIENLKAGEITQGGSTITQQVARILFAEEELRQEREQKTSSAKWWRKFREAYLAAKLQGRIPREQILELYLNNVYCGEGRYGVKSCSRYYFDKSPTELNVADAAFIMATLRRPTVADEPEEARFARDRVLNQLAREGKISLTSKEEMEKLPVPGVRMIVYPCSASHANEFVRRRITERTRLVDTGLRVYTTINCGWQDAAALALRESFEELRKRHPEIQDLRGVAILISRHNGAIKAFVQEPSFQENQYLIDQVKRRAGSAFKPFFYLTWLLNGGRLSCKDAGSGPCKLDDSYGVKDGPSALYLPLGGGRGVKHIQNFPYQGLARYIGMAEPILCIAESRNVCTMSGVEGVLGSRAHRLVSKEDIIRIAVELGIRLETFDPEIAAQRGLDFIKPALARSLNIPPNTLDPGHTVAIGSINVSALEMVRAFSGFFGELPDPFIIEKVENAAGQKLYSSVAGEPRQVFKVPEVEDSFITGTKEFEPAVKKREAALVERDRVFINILRALRATIEFPHGTGKKAKKELDFQVMGKTGTATNEQGETTDNWFVGCTPSYCMSIWFGREREDPLPTIEVVDENGKKEIVQETGGRNALPAFIETMIKVYQNQPREYFPVNTDPLRPFKFETGEKADNTAVEPTPSEIKDDF